MGQALASVGECMRRTDVRANKSKQFSTLEGSIVIHYLPALSAIISRSWSGTSPTREKDVGLSTNMNFKVIPSHYNLQVLKLDTVSS